MDIISINGNMVYASNEVVDQLDILKRAHGGGFGHFTNYVSSSKRDVDEVANITFTSRYSNANLNAKKKQVLVDVAFDDVSFTSPKLTTLSLDEQKAIFIKRKAFIMSSIEKTQNKLRDDAHRKAHDKFYVQVVNGIKVKLESKGTKGLKELVLKDGLPIVAQVMVMGLEVSRKVVQKGVYKQVDSGVDVLMGNAILKVLKARGVKEPRSFSLAQGKYDKLKISSEEVVG
jgi:hypothetical protein